MGYGLLSARSSLRGVALYVCNTHGLIPVCQTMTPSSLVIQWETSFAPRDTLYYVVSYWGRLLLLQYRHPDGRPIIMRCEGSL